MMFDEAGGHLLSTLFVRFCEADPLWKQEPPILLGLKNHSSCRFPINQRSHSLRYHQEVEI